MLDLSDPTKQIAYYDPGVGTFAATGAWTPWARWWSKTMGLAFGSGLRENLGEAYSWLMQNWVQGDQVYLFGFSRGAYNARAVLGLLRALGLIRTGSENFVPYIVASYSGSLEDMHADAGVFAQTVDAEGHTTVPIQFLGLWDTVKAAGFFRRSITWPFTRQLPSAERIRHAVSIDERRRPFREYLIDEPNDSSREEVWFTGVHSDVGGTYTEHKLSTITLKWVAEEAVAQGLLVRRKKYEFECDVRPDFAVGTLHKNGAIWRLLGTRQRPIPSGARVHESVKARMASDKSYNPIGNVDVTWADPDWTTLR